MSQIANLEVTLSEIEAKLNAKDLEVQKTQGKFPNDIDTKIKILQTENNKLKESTKLQQNEIWKNEIAQNLQFKTIYESSYKDLVEKFYSKGQPLCSNNPLEAEKNKLLVQIKKQEILLQEAVNDRNYIKNEVLPVLEHTMHLFEKNKIDLDAEIENLEKKLKIASNSKPDNIIYEEDESDAPKNHRKVSREYSPAISPKNSLQYTFISSNKFSARPSTTLVDLGVPRGKILRNSLKTKKNGK